MKPTSSQIAIQREVPSLGVPPSDLLSHLTLQVYLLPRCTQYPLLSLHLSYSSQFPVHTPRRSQAGNHCHRPNTAGRAPAIIINVTPPAKMAKGCGWADAMNWGLGCILICCPLNLRWAFQNPKCLWFWMDCGTRAIGVCGSFSAKCDPLQGSNLTPPFWWWYSDNEILFFHWEEWSVHVF